MNCPPTGVSHSGNASGPPNNPGNQYLISELDQNNPVVVCDPRMTQEDTYQVDGVTDVNGYQSDPRVVHKTVSKSYDGNNQGVSAYDYGNMSTVDTTGNDVCVSITPPQVRIAPILCELFMLGRVLNLSKYQSKIVLC